MAISINNISNYYTRLDLNYGHFNQGTGQLTQEAQNSKEAKGTDEVGGINKVQCQTCSERKYQDGSDDPSVSFKTPSKISPENAGSVVRAHEQEHVSHESAKAQINDRKVVSQTVSLHTGICPECGKTYVSGGTTRTVTKADNEERKDYFLSNYNDMVAKNFGMIIDTRI